MPGYNSQRRGTARTSQFFFLFIVMYVPFSVFYVLFVCKCVLYCCHRVSTQLLLKTNNNNNNIVQRFHHKAECNSTTFQHTCAVVLFKPSARCCSVSVNPNPPLQLVYLLVIYSTTLSAARNTEGWLVSNGFEEMWKKMIIT
jgi:hypothetical protein